MKGISFNDFEETRHPSTLLLTFMKGGYLLFAKYRRGILHGMRYGIPKIEKLRRSDIKHFYLKGILEKFGNGHFIA